jgi:hypothetical protein
MIGLASGEPVTITGHGRHVPERVLGNEELAETMPDLDSRSRSRMPRPTTGASNLGNLY